MNIPVLGADVFAELGVDTALSLGVASLGCGQVAAELRDAVTLVLGQVKVTSLVDDLEALALSTPVVKQVNGSGISKCLAGSQGGDTSDQAAEHLRVIQAQSVHVNRERHVARKQRNRHMSSILNVRCQSSGAAASTSPVALL